MNIGFEEPCRKSNSVTDKTDHVGPQKAQNVQNDLTVNVDYNQSENTLCFVPICGLISFLPRALPLAKAFESCKTRQRNAPNMGEVS
jgi:hypothetical protein